MKNLLPIKLVSIVISGSLLLSSCEHDHEIHKKPFKVNTTTWYRISPTSPMPIAVNGVDYVGFAYFPGGGTGNATHLGNCHTFFNQLAYGTSPEAPPSGSIGAPVADVPHYPVTGAPLPLIQVGDFNLLASAISTFHIPATVYDKKINQALYNNKGDAIFLSAIDGSGATVPVSGTRVEFNGKALIMGGRGKFQHAIGEINYSGYFNPANANDAAYNADGWIDY